MCGIFGIVSKANRSFPLNSSVDTLRHRGPDDSALYYDDNICLGHRRLSIIDLEGGHQPIFNEDQSKCIVFNGEIYNYLQLRNELLNKGHRFSTRSDTETILHAYEEWGEKCVDYFRGMFAFAIWDSRDQRLFIARDRLGIKPLFYAEHKGKFYFASEMKAILADRAFPRDIDEMALACYFTLSYIPAPLTIYRSIRKLLPGHIQTIKNGKIRTHKYWDLYFEPARGRDENYFIQEFMKLLQESVKINVFTTKNDFLGKDHEIKLIIEGCFSLDYISEPPDAIEYLENAIILIFESEYVSPLESKTIQFTFTINIFDLVLRPIIFILLLILISSLYVLIVKTRKEKAELAAIKKEYIPISEIREFCSLYEEKIALIVEIRNAEEDVKRKKLIKKKYKNIVDKNQKKIEEIEREIIPFKKIIGEIDVSFENILKKLEVLEAERLSVKDGLNLLEARYKRGRLPSRAAYMKLSDNFLNRQKKIDRSIDKNIRTLRSYLL